MSDQLRPCPFCGNTNPEIVSGDAICCCTGECWAQNGYDEWQKPRTPGPATKAMLKRLEELNQQERLTGKYQSWATNLDINMVLAFLAEWNQLPPE